MGKASPKQPSKSRLLKEHLLEQLSKRRIPLGAKLPSEARLMQEFLVSRSTVRQVLTELSIQGLVDRQQGRGTFHVPRNAAEPRTQRSMLIGVWFNWPSGPLFGPIAKGIQEELSEWGYHAVFEVGGLESGAEYRGVENLIRKELDGFIVSPSTNLKDEHGPLTELIRRDAPLVLVDRQLAGYEKDLVCTHNEMGAEEVVNHLIGLGHRRIGFVGVRGFSTVEDRLCGYRQTMQRHRLTIDEAWVHVEAEVAANFGRPAACEILSLPPDQRPTAIFGATDVIAENIAVEAKQLGLEIPRDLSIAGFDDVTLDPSSLAWLTTYAQPKYRIGRQAARLLMNRLQRPAQHNVIILLEGKLVERASTAPPPQARPQGPAQPAPAGEA
jgi:GntR family transcriptional regulator, arabinose operon transcriptional repressor